MAGETQKRITIEPIEFNVLVGGPADGPIIVLAHALMANLHMWDSTVHALHRAGYQTIRYDQVGHGDTSIPPSPQCHFDDFTRSMREILAGSTRTISTEQAPHVHAIIGCSMGGVLALRYSMLFPDSVSKIIACDAPGLDALEVSKPKWQARVEEFRAHGSDELCHQTVERWFPPPCDDATKEAALKQVKSCSLEGYEACAYAIQRYKYKDELSTKVRATTMILVGENDEAVGPPEVLKDVADRIPGSTYVCMKDAGHLPPMHRPDEFERVILDFLA